MAIELLASGTSATRSADKTLAAGKELVIYLKDAAGPVVPLVTRVHIQIKDGAEYFTLHTLDGKDPSGVLKASSDEAMVFAVYREACDSAVGVGATGAVA